MKRYIGDFTMRDNGQVIPARVVITPETYDGDEEMTMGADPAVLTWESVELTDAVQGSQLLISAVAQYDGQFRDLIGQIKTRVVLKVKDGADWRPIWHGLLADMAWEEEYSRELGYPVEMTFSDFNSMSRMSADEVFTRRVDIVKNYVWQAISIFLQEDADMDDFLECVPDSGLRIGSTDYPSLRLMKDGLSADKDGNVLDALEDILAPLHLRIVQQMGKFWIISPNDTLMWDSDNASSLCPAGTDAVMSVADIYGRASLSYDSEVKDTLAEMVPESPSSFGAWCHVIDEYNVNINLIMCGKRIERAPYVGHCVEATAYLTVNDLGKRTFFLQTGCDTMFNSPFTIPSGADDPEVNRTITSPDILNVRLEHSVSSKRQRSDMPGFLTRVKLEFGIVMSRGVFLNFPFADDTEMQDVRVRIPCVIKFTPWNGSIPLYWDGTEWQRNSVQVHITSQSSPFSSSFAVLTESIILNDSMLGTITADILFNQPVLTNMPSGQSAASVLWYLVDAARLSFDSRVENSLSEDIGGAIAEEFSDMSSEEFSKTFRHGASPWLTAFSFNLYDYDGVMSGSLLDMYMSFLRDNNPSGDNGMHIRRIVKGSYMYPHLNGQLPVFMHTSSPLSALFSQNFSFIMRSEEWHLREGISSMEVEEFYAPRMGRGNIIFNPSDPGNLNPPQTIPDTAGLYSINGILFKIGNIEVIGDNALYVVRKTQGENTFYGRILSVSSASQVVIKTSTGARILKMTFIPVEDDASPDDLELSCGTLDEKFSWTGEEKEIIIKANRTFTFYNITITYR